MLIAGAKGTAKEVVFSLTDYLNSEKHHFFDNISDDLPEKLYDKWPIIKTNQEAELYFNNITRDYIVAVGFPDARKILYNLLLSLGGNPVSYINETYKFYETKISDKGVLISVGVYLAPKVIIEDGVFINAGAFIGYNCHINKFSVICPSVILKENNIVGEKCFIGTKSIIYPNIKIGDNSVIAAGAIVTQDVPPGHLAHGKPAIFRKLDKV